MGVLESEQYEDLAIEWQYQMICILKNTLSKHEIAADKAEEIIGEFAFNFAMLHDQDEIKSESKSYNPRICFDDFSGNLHITSEETNLHEYAFGSTSEAFSK